ncbi:MAG: hypothetical protein IPK13_14840 [Deltaproteobacteria bacterium]|nr:hypothetical protein [Deltaproteobacteria bacterium]
MSAIALATLAASASANAGDKYTAADIQALVNEENWTEVLEHLSDIPPTKRDASWKTALEKAAVGHLTSVLASDQGYSSLGTADVLIGRYAALKKSQAFMKLRQDSGLKYFEQCFNNRYSGPECAEGLISFVKTDPTNDELAFRAGQMARMGAGYGPAAVLFEIAFKTKARRKDCGDRQVVIATTMTLGNLQEGDVPFEAAKKVAFDYCYDALKKDLLSEFNEASTYYLKATCPTLTKKKALTAFQTALCKDTAAGK